MVFILPKVYPRVCGGTVLANNAHVLIRGLSPRVRGNPRWRRCAGSRTRSIPACAGEPALAARRRQPDEVYPRVCGGTSVAAGWADCGKGLSPRVRGNL